MTKYRRNKTQFVIIVFPVLAGGVIVTLRLLSFHQLSTEQLALTTSFLMDAFQHDIIECAKEKLATMPVP